MFVIAKMANGVPLARISTDAIRLGGDEEWFNGLFALFCSTPLPAVKSSWQLCVQNKWIAIRFRGKIGVGTPFALLSVVGLTTRDPRLSQPWRLIN
tara:strand:+ start:60 stop:347 length:288 start_codon:yes stop_codon:yes gene_type:complete